MAKKKSEASATKASPTAEKKAAPRKAAGPASPAASSGKPPLAKAKVATRSNRTTASTATPLVDTNLAAQAAAQMLAAGIGRRENQPGAADQDKREGSLIRQLKSELNKGHAQTVSNVLDKGAPQGQKRGSGGMPFGQKQVGHNQTYGADLTRSGVPRRTSG